MPSSAGSGAASRDDTGGRGAPDALGRAVALAGLTILVALLAGLEVLPRWPGLLHLVALPPIAHVADLKVLLVLAPDPAWFLTGLVVSSALRVVLLAVLLGGLTRDRLRLAIRYYLLVLPLSLLAAAQLFASLALLFYALFWFGLATLIVAALLTAGLPWTPAPQLRRRALGSLRRGGRAGTVLAYLAVLTGLGALAEALPPGATLLLLPVSAALTLGAIVVLEQPRRLRRLRRGLALLPAAAIAGLIAIVMTGPAAPPTGAVTDPAGGSLLLMSGIDSASGTGAMLEIDPRTLGFGCDQTYYVSYAGPGDGQPRNDARCPITTGAPYGPEDTLRSRDELVPWLEAQISAAPDPVTAFVHSQGVWLAWDAASRHRMPGLGFLVLVGAFPENPVSFPADPGDRAAGAVGARLLAIFERLPRPGGGTSSFALEAPLTEEWLADPDRISTVLARPLPDTITVVSITSVFDAPLMPNGWTIDGAIDACPVPVAHPNLPYADEVLSAVSDPRDADASRCPLWRTAVGPLVRPYGVPPTP